MLRFEPPRAALLVAFVAAILLALGCGEPDPPRNAVLIVLDTLRADRLSAYGYPNETSPVLDALAQEGALFEITVSNASWTLPAMVGLLGGDFPTKKIYGTRLDRSVVEAIRDAGLRTAAFVEGGFVSEQYGFDRGFDDFTDESQGTGDHSVGIEQTFRDAEAWLRENHAEPFFLLVHTYEPHTPYTRIELTGGLDSGSLGETFEVMDAARVRKQLLPFGATERTYVRALYDGGVAASDRHVGQLLELLDELEIRDRTAIVVTSDHGEDIGGREPEWPGVHGHTLYDEQVLVPLIIHDPTREYPVKRITSQVRTIDTLHSIVDILGLPPAPSRYGKSVVPLMKGEEDKDRFAWSKSSRSEYFGYDERYALRTGAHKLILTPLEDGKVESELYDIASDPGERVNVYMKKQFRRARLQRLLMGLMKELEADGIPEFKLRAGKKSRKSETEQRLRELGYIE